MCGRVRSRVLDAYLIDDNTKRPHQGRGMGGRTPLGAFRDGIRKPSKQEATTGLRSAA
jgi:hypothetical protein